MKLSVLEMPSLKILRMVIEIKEDIFEGNDFKGLNFLIQLATYKNRYVVVADLTKIIGTKLYNRLELEDREFLEANFNKQILEQSKHLKKNTVIQLADCFITSNANGNNKFLLEEAIIFLIQPVSIVLENSLNDSYFIKALIRHFDEKGELTRHMENGWLQFENAGGCDNIINFLNGKLQSFTSLTKSNECYLRCFVLLDSDRLYPSLAISYKNPSLEQFLQRNRVCYHILEKRSMENYLPDEVFDEFKNGVLDTWVNAYKYLNPSQKDFLNFAEGISEKENKVKKNRTELKIEVQQLYENLSDASFTVLSSGFALANFKVKFS